MILYFTGTGNSRWVAERLADATRDVAIALTDYIRRGTVPQGLADADAVGVVFPIHSWYAPRLLADYLSRLQLPHGSYRYAVCTCGDDVGKGMERLAKRFPLDAAWSVAMPNTYVPMFNLDEDALCRTKIMQARRAVALIAEAVIARKRVWQVHEGGAAWLKTYVLNPLFVRFIIEAKGFSVDEGCISCGVCGNACPVENIRLVDGRPVWGEACVHCMACLHACPQEVIQYKRATQKKGRYRLADYL